MATLVDLDERDLAELKALTKETDPAAAIRLAMTEFLRFARRLQLKTLSGNVQMENNWQSLEAAELRDDNGGSGSCVH